GIWSVQLKIGIKRINRVTVTATVTLTAGAAASPVAAAAVAPTAVVKARRLSGVPVCTSGRAWAS
ncbi:hypothetical protein AB0G92_20910, partial [Streptomyces californicus]